MGAYLRRLSCLRFFRVVIKLKNQRLLIDPVRSANSGQTACRSVFKRLPKRTFSTTNCPAPSCQSFQLSVFFRDRLDLLDHVLGPR